jgi:hypothetical protein
MNHQAPATLDHLPRMNALQGQPDSLHREPDRA